MDEADRVVRTSDATTCSNGCGGVQSDEVDCPAVGPAGGRPAADDVAYWDVVAALSTPPDLSWFGGAIAGQGRSYVVDEVLIERRDAFRRGPASARKGAARKGLALWLRCVAGRRMRARCS